MSTSALLSSQRSASSIPSSTTVPSIPSSTTAPTIPSSATAPAILPLALATSNIPTGQIFSSTLSPTSPSSPRASSLTKNKSLKNPLTIPEILELVLAYVLAQFQTTSRAQDPFAFPSSTFYSITTPNDIQLQIRAQKPISTRLAFLRVCRLWYQIGEPLIWKNIKWTDYQHPEVHQRIWNHWSRVRSIEFEYGKKTTDTEPPLVTPETHEILSNINTDASSNTTTTNASTSTNWTNGPRARMRNFLGGDSSASTTQHPPNSTSLPSTSNTRAQSNVTRGGDNSASMAGRPRITLEEALHSLARSMSFPSHLPHYSPTPLPLKGIHFTKRIPHITPAPYSALVPLLHRSQLTSLTLTGLFRLETFLQAILPFLPELRYLDICLRCYEWRDEIRLDKVLRSCPKLQYLSVDRNMIGRVQFDDPSDNEGSDDNQEYDSDEYDEHRSDVENHDKYYSGTSWHLKYARSTYMDNGDGKGKPTRLSRNKSDSDRGAESQKKHQPKRRKFQQRPLMLRVLKLKKVRMMEQDFVKLLKLCPHLEEMDVFSTIYWSWTRTFLQTVSQSCPKIKRLHLTTNYNVGGSNSNDGPSVSSSMQAGVIIYHETPQEFPPLQNGPISNGTSNAANTQLNGGILPALPTVTSTPNQGQSIPIFDPVIELIDMYPALLSYDARYVRFQDRALSKLQQHCHNLESLDLTSCKEVSSKAVDKFLRYMPTLKHFSGSQIILRVEDIIELQEEHDRIMAMNEEIRANAECLSSEMDSVLQSPGLKTLVPEPRWWACEGLETFVIGIKNPAPPGSDGNFDLQGENSADYLYYYRDIQGSGSSSNGAKANPLGGNVNEGIASGRRYDHTLYCTFILFEQLGRLRRLKRLELRGGRFDLGIVSSLDSPCLSNSPQRYSPFSDRDSPMLEKDQFRHSDKEKEGQSGSMARRILGRTKSLLTMGSIFSKNKQKMEGDSFLQDSKNKGKSKLIMEENSKGRKVERPNDIDTVYDLYLQESDSSEEEYQNTDKLHPNIGLDSNLYSNKIVPSYLTGMQPLAGLTNLVSFSLTWSNFPMLHEKDVAWVCQNWPSLEWISLGLVPEGEWDEIRHWIRSRRSDVVVVFEK
ncbi:hypothetical protein BGZ76_003574 [Entomortierella beljakovae]|nr:hypothetical protein BGZ76_003574 [Entomortierella beljakovae]